MTDTIKQDQKAGNNSINVQVNNHGLSLSETQQLVKQEVEYRINTILQDNLIKLQEEARVCANTRANELTQMFFDKLLKLPQEITEQVLDKLKTPSVQMSIFEAQKGYIKSGKTEKLELLSSLLRDKISTEHETLKNILIDEALEVIPKLNKAHIDFLTCMVYLSATDSKANNWQSFTTSILNFIVDLYQEIHISSNDISFLSQLRCLEINQIQNRLDLYDLLKEKYKGLFSAGLDEKNLNMEILNKIKPSVLMPCLNNSTKYQLRFLNEDILENELREEAISERELSIIKGYFNPTLSKDEIKEKIKKMNPKFDSVVAKLNKYNRVFLTPLGILIGISNYKERFKEDINWEF